MKRLTRLEFYERIEALARAREIFMPHFTENISLAFEIYQKVLATREREVFLNSMNDYNQPKLFDHYERPKCPICGAMLYLRSICKKGIIQNGNRFGWKTSWFCIAENCIYEEHSKKSVKDWMKKLRRKE